MESMKTERIVVLEATMDDADGKTLAYTVERLLAEGALDAYLVPAVMKKGRPGHTLTALTKPEDAERLAHVMFEETPTLGVRITETKRFVLPRRIVTVRTPYGAVRVKVTALGAEPEYEDCAALARKNKVALRKVIGGARRARNQF